MRGCRARQTHRIYCGRIQPPRRAKTARKSAGPPHNHLVPSETMCSSCNNVILLIPRLNRRDLSRGDSAGGCKMLLQPNERVCRLSPKSPRDRPAQMPDVGCGQRFPALGEEMSSLSDGYGRVILLKKCLFSFRRETNLTLQQLHLLLCLA